MVEMSEGVRAARCCIRSTYLLNPSIYYIAEHTIMDGIIDSISYSALFFFLKRIILLPKIQKSKQPDSHQMRLSRTTSAHIQ